MGKNSYTKPIESLWDPKNNIGKTSGILKKKKKPVLQILVLGDIRELYIRAWSLISLSS